MTEEDVVASPRGYVSGGGLVPVPDPTKLTTDQLRQEIKALRELTEATINAKVNIVATKLSGHEDLYKVLKERVDRKDEGVVSEIGHLKTLIDSNISVVRGEVGNLGSVTGETVKRIETMISERDSRADQRAGDVKSAVDTAFLNAKEAISKIEAVFTKQIDAMGTTINEKTQNLDRLISDLKDRLTSIESRGQGSHSATDRTFAIIMACAAVAGPIVSILLLRSNPISH